jgi:hypothetical protein
MSKNRNAILTKLTQKSYSLNELGITMSVIRELRNDGYNIIGKNTNFGRVYYIPKSDDSEKTRYSLLIEAKEAVAQYGSINAAAKVLGIARSTLHGRYQTAIKEGVYDQENDGKPREKLKVTSNTKGITIDYCGAKIKTPEQLILDAGVDLDIWEIAETVINNWEVGGKIHQGQEIHRDTTGKITSQWKPQKLWKTGLRQIKIRLRKIPDERIALKSILDRIEANSPIVRKIQRPKIKKSSPRRCLEISIMDPHFGMKCYNGSSDHEWDMDQCEQTIMWALDALIEHGLKFEPIEEIVFPFGNDFLHADNLSHTTTAGTLQPEMLSYHKVYERAEELAVSMVQRLAEIAPVKVYQIPGNHDQQSSYTLGRFLKAYFKNNENIDVDAGPETYKFHRYGTNLIGFEHGHNIAPIRLAAVMANEAIKHWGETTYREWHLGDQHRKGSSKPVTFEEQGVSVEYLPGLTPPNEWHKKKSFNYQKRGATAYVWDYHTGPTARLQINFNSYTGLPTGQTCQKSAKNG